MHMFKINMKKHISIIGILVMIFIAFAVVPTFAEGESTEELKNIIYQVPNSEYAVDEFITQGATTRYFNVEIKVNKDYSYEVTETIDALFNWGKHGIARYIPISGNYKIDNISVEGDEYEVRKKEGNYVIKIGNADREVKGEKSYRIKYTIHNYLQSNAKNHVYIDVIPINWEMIIMNANVKVQLPDDFKYTDMKSYTGGYGSTSDFGRWVYDEKNNTLYFSANMIPSKYGITLLAYAPEGYWQGAPSKGWTNPLNVGIIITCLAAIIVIKLRSKKDKEIIVPVMFNPPEGITPAELGYLVDEHVDREDIVSLYLYLASKGYIKIIEGDSRKDTIIRALNTPLNEPEYVNEFYEALFGSTKHNTIGKEVDIETAGENIGESYKQIKSQIEWKFEGEKSIYSKKSKNLEFTSIIIGYIGFVSTLLFTVYKSNLVFYDNLVTGISLIGMSIIIATMWGSLLESLRMKIFYRKSNKASKSMFGMLFSAIAYVLFIIGLNVLILFLSKSDTPIYVNIAITVYSLVLPFFIIGIKSRSAYNRKIYGEIIGFRNFIELAEVDKINELVEQNPSYFYDVLPYAYVFKLTKKWVKKFENIKVPNNSGYAGHGTNAFDYMNIHWMMHGIERTTFDGISVSNPDVGGGIFSGGGFSGGGAGGGGGGAW